MGIQWHVLGRSMGNVLMNDRWTVRRGRVRVRRWRVRMGRGRGGPVGNRWSRRIYGMMTRMIIPGHGRWWLHHGSVPTRRPRSC